MPHKSKQTILAKKLRTCGATKLPLSFLKNRLSLAPGGILTNGSEAAAVSTNQRPSAAFATLILTGMRVAERNSDQRKSGENLVLG